MQARDRDSGAVVSVLAQAFSSQDKYIQDTVMMALAEDQADGHTGNWLLSKSFAKVRACSTPRRYCCVLVRQCDPCYLQHHEVVPEGRTESAGGGPVVTP